MDIDTAAEVWKRLRGEIEAQLDQINSESDARLHIIDRVLIEVLGWSRTSISTEKHSDSGFADYLVKIDERTVMVLEAKRSNKILIDTVNPRRATYKVGGPALRSAHEGVKQAQRYCIDHGASYAVLSTGIEWIAFFAVRTDGKAPDEGMAIVFPTLESVTESFAEFFDLFSRRGVSQELHRIKLLEAEGLVVLPSEDMVSISDPRKITLSPKSPMAIDLDRIFSEFFSNISGDSDPEMLAKCFVESKESREADNALEKIALNLLAQVEVVSSDGAELEQHIANAIQTKRGEFVLIIGNKGAGKSTFIARFFQLVLGRDLREKCLIAKIDLLDSSGDMETLSSWLTEQLLSRIEGALFAGGKPTYDELQGIFFGDYQRWKNGEFRPLYESDKVAFKIKFGEYLYAQTQDNRAHYVECLLKHIVDSRRLLPCIVFDNADHYPQAFQERVFQFAQSVYRQVLAFIICPITDRTIWQLSKSGPLQSYDTTPFYLPIPSTKDVLSKRIDFIRAKIDTDKQEKGEYFTERGIRLNISNLRAFAAVVEDVFIKAEYVGRLIGWLSNHDIRRGLLIAKRIITSPIIGTSGAVTAYLTGSRNMLQDWKIKRALFQGDYSGFQQSESDFVMNLFTVSPRAITTPLGTASVLRCLLDAQGDNTDANEAYRSVRDMVNYLEPMGVARQATMFFCAELLRRRLVEPYDPTDDEISMEQRIRITHSGEIHLEFVLTDDTYIRNMAYATPITDRALVQAMRTRLFGRNQERMQADDWRIFISKFAQYCIKEDKHFINLPTLPSYASQADMRKRFTEKWVWEE